MEWTVFIPMCMMNDGSCLVYYFFLVPMIDFLFPISRLDKMSLWIKYVWPLCFIASMLMVEKHWLSSLSAGVVYAQAIGFSTNIARRKRFSLSSYYTELFSPLLILMPMMIWNGYVAWHLLTWMIGIILYSTSECLDLDYTLFPIENAVEDTHGFALGDMTLFHHNNIIYMPQSRPWMMMRYWIYPEKI